MRRLLLNYARSLRLSRELVQRAWGFVNDFLFIPTALELPPPTLACAALYLGAKLSDELNALNRIKGPEGGSWMSLFGVDERSAALACNLLLDSYLDLHQEGEADRTVHDNREATAHNIAVDSVTTGGAAGAAATGSAEAPNRHQ